MIDTSAIVAILNGEAGHQELLDAISQDVAPTMSVVTALELHVVATRGLGYRQADLEDLLDDLGIAVVPADASQMAIAKRAYDTYGKGGGHAAKLNICDCFSYALSIATGQPLLFVGDDFGHTDVAPALPPRD